MPAVAAKMTNAQVPAAQRIMNASFSRPRTRSNCPPYRSAQAAVRRGACHQRVRMNRSVRGPLAPISLSSIDSKAR